jgi:predicted O-methyltransferase YrrM
MTEPAAEYRFYGNLASWWPLISPPPEYAEEAGEAAKLLASASGTVREVLELGSGGGHNAVHLKQAVPPPEQCSTGRLTITRFATTVK